MAQARYVTDTKAATLTLPGDPVARQALLADATAIYQHVNTNEFIKDDDLRTWADTQGITPERVTAAITFALETGRLVRL